MTDETELLQSQVIEGDPQALGQLMLRYQDRILRVLEFRMDRRLRSRLDAGDVLQEAFVEATQRLEDYRKVADQMPFFLWLRFIAIQKLMQQTRFHLGTQARDANREVSIFQAPQPQATSAVLAAHLLGSITSPSNAAVRDENRKNLERALGEMNDADREALALRHFEQLTNAETARVLQITEKAASNRYFRALGRLKKVMDRLQSNFGSGIFR